MLEPVMEKIKLFQMQHTFNLKTNNRVYFLHNKNMIVLINTSKTGTTITLFMEAHAKLYKTQKMKSMSGTRLVLYFTKYSCPCILY